MKIRNTILFGRLGKNFLVSIGIVADIARGCNHISTFFFCLLLVYCDPIYCESKICRMGSEKAAKDLSLHDYGLMEMSEWRETSHLGVCGGG